MSSFITIPRVCNECGKTKRLRVNAAGYDRWRGGMLIQDALPELTADDRELLITSTCGECYDEAARKIEEMERKAEAEDEPKEGELPY